MISFLYKCMIYLTHTQPGRVVQSVVHRTRTSEVMDSIPGLVIYFVSVSADSKGAVVSYW